MEDALIEKWRSFNFGPEIGIEFLLFFSDLDFELSSLFCEMPVLESEGNQNTFKSGNENEKATIKMYECNLCPYSNKNSGTLYHHKKTNIILTKFHAMSVEKFLSVVDTCKDTRVMYTMQPKSHVTFAPRSSRKVK